uniref:Glucosylceramidase n=1 Tax=Amazona collaria TaxID=241587 RepID=A0A8B9GGL8_9PSIT
MLLPSTSWGCRRRPRTSCCNPTSQRAVSREHGGAQGVPGMAVPLSPPLGHPLPGCSCAARCLSYSTGIEYNLIRLPIACSDFSTRPYSYDDVADDYELKHFKLAEEDVKMKIPLLHRASAVSQRPLLLYGSPWTAPAWMRSNGDVRGKGTLKGQAGDKYHKTWANYFIKFLDEYAKHNVTFWAVTVQNEPLGALLSPSQFPTIVFTAEQQRDFVVQDLGPALAQSSHRTQLIILDDQSTHLPHWAKVVKGKATLPCSVLSLLAPSHQALGFRCKPSPEPLCVRLDRLEPGPGHEGGPQLGQELRGQPRHRGQQQGHLLQAAHVLPHGALQVGHGREWGWGDATSLRGGPHPCPAAVPAASSSPRARSAWGCSRAAGASSASSSTWPSCARMGLWSWWCSTGQWGMAHGDTRPRPC